MLTFRRLARPAFQLTKLQKWVAHSAFLWRGGVFRCQPRGWPIRRVVPVRRKLWRILHVGAAEWTAKAAEPRRGFRGGRKAAYYGRNKTLAAEAAFFQSQASGPHIPWPAARISRGRICLRLADVGLFFTATTGTRPLSHRVVTGILSRSLPSSGKLLSWRGIRVSRRSPRPVRGPEGAL